MGMLSLDKAVFQAHFPNTGFLVRHNLQQHALLTLEHLITLAQTLPSEQVEYNLGNISVDYGANKAPLSALSVTETIQQIETCQSWMVLKHVEQCEPYQALLDACLDEVYPLATRSLSGLHNRSAFIFITSPNSVTPYHIDPEHNFLLQIQGNKTMFQFDGQDESLLPQHLLEEKYMHAHSHRNLPFQSSFQSKATTFELSAGDGLFVPINAPHWVKNGTEVSVSLSITFHSNESVRKAQLHKLNGWLRQSVPWKPAVIGHYPWLDHVKHRTFLAARHLKHWF